MRTSPIVASLILIAITGAISATPVAAQEPSPEALVEEVVRLCYKVDKNGVLPCAVPVPELPEELDLFGGSVDGDGMVSCSGYGQDGTCGDSDYYHYAWQSHQIGYCQNACGGRGATDGTVDLYAGHGSPDTHGWCITFDAGEAIGYCASTDTSPFDSIEGGPIDHSVSGYYSVATYGTGSSGPDD